MPRISKAELIELQKSVRTDVAIGRKLGCTRQNVQLLRKSYGIRPIPGARTVIMPPRFTKDELIQLQKKYEYDRVLGKKVGLSEGGVRRWRIKYGIPALDHDTTKRNKEIVSLYKKGMTGIAIAKKFGLSFVWVYTIIGDAGAGKRKAAAEKLPARKGRHPV